MNDCSTYLERHCWWTMYNQGTVRNQVHYLHITVKWIENLIRKSKGQIWALSDGRHCSQTFCIQIHKENVGEKRWILAASLDGHFALRRQVMFPWGPALNLWKEIIINNWTEMSETMYDKSLATSMHAHTNT